MKTVKEVSELTGVSIRTLQYYDKIGLLLPTTYTKSGYRLYDDGALETLQQILLFRELEFSLKEIKKIILSANFDRKRALEQQIELLALKKEHLDNLINLAREIKMLGEKNMDFSVFDNSKIEEYKRQAKEQWGETLAYKEFAEKTKNKTKEEDKKAAHDMMQFFASFGEMKELNPASEGPQKEVKKLQDFISANFYHCTDEILDSLGKMYAAGGEFTENIDVVGGKGTAEFVTKAIQVYCGK